MSHRSTYRTNGPRPIPVGGIVIRETNTSPYPAVGRRVEAPWLEPIPDGHVVVQWDSPEGLRVEPDDQLVHLPLPSEEDIRRA